jgi:cytochrome c oxidase cbb3-type subunit 3/ubiquinol-cytochrome c reductase cytochrome c subunit
MRARFFRSATSTLFVALSLAGCTRKNGTHLEASPEGSAGSKLTGQAAAGQALYAQYCKLCHAADGTGYAADNAPSLVSQNFLRSATDEFIAHGISVGRPGTAMGAYGKARGGPLSETQISTIVAFLRTKGPYPTPLPEAPLIGNAQSGAEIFNKNCERCHGGADHKATAPSLDNREFLASAKPAFIRFAIENGRPPTPMPPFGGTLSGDEINDIVMYLSGRAPTGPLPPVLNTEIPKDLPVIINPNGAQANFTLVQDRFVSAEQVKRALDAKQRIVILDARTPADWIQFHIPGAISFPYHDKSNIDRIPTDGTWVVAYCACPHHASGEVVDALREHHYPKTAVLDEGILVWKQLGYPIAGEAVDRGEFPSMATPEAQAPAAPPITPPAPPPPPPKPAPAKPSATPKP